MPSIDPLDVIVLVLSLIMLGPRRLLEVGRSLGRALRGFAQFRSPVRAHPKRARHGPASS